MYSASLKIHFLPFSKRYHKNSFEFCDPKNASLNITKTENNSFFNFYFSNYFLCSEQAMNVKLLIRYFLRGVHIFSSFFFLYGLENAIHKLFL